MSNKISQIIKKSFSLIEIIFVLVILAIISSMIIPKQSLSKLDIASKNIVLYLNFTRYISHIDNKLEKNIDNGWKKRLWTLKFRNCDKNIGGIYYNVYSDINKKGRANDNECLKDPIDGKIINSNRCNEDIYNKRSKYVLLTQEYGINKIDVSCYEGSGLGYISFGYDGKVYSRLGNNPKEIKKPCRITLYDKKNNYVTIQIEPNTGYIHKL